MKKIILAILLCSLLVCGCYNYRELNELAIINGISVDKKDDKYEVSFLLSNTKKSETQNSSNETDNVIYTGNGKTVTEAVKDVEMILPKKYYLGHLSIILISDEIAYNGINDVIDYFGRQPETPNNAYIVLTKETKAKDILSMVSPIETFTSNNIYFMINNSSNLASIVNNSKINNFVNDTLKEGISPTLTSLEKKGSSTKGEKLKNTETSDQKNYIKTSTLGAFKNGYLIGFFNENESIGVNLINNNVNEFSINLKCKDKNMSLIIKNVKTKLNVDDDLNVILDIKGNADLSEINCDLDLKKNEVIKNIEKQINNKIKKMINETISKVKEYKTDVLKIGNYLYRKKNNLWNLYKENWEDEVFPNLNFKIKTDFKLISKGVGDQTIEVIINEKK